MTTTQQRCTSADHDAQLEEFGCCDTCGAFADETDNDDEIQRQVADFERSDVDGYDRNGAFDGFQVTSDADNGL